MRANRIVMELRFDTQLDGNDTYIEIYEGQLRVYIWNEEQIGNDSTITELYTLEDFGPSMDDGG